MRIDNDDLARLEAALIARDSVFAEKLQPGLDERSILKELKRGKVVGATAALIPIYSWKNGTNLDRDYISAGIGFLPGSKFHFVELGAAVDDLDFFKQASENHPRIAPAVDRYFPLFWNGKTDWVVTDLAAGSQNRLLQVEFDAEHPFRELYDSFDTFFVDLLEANIGNRPMKCFRNA